MKYLNRIEILEFTKKYFPAYIGDIRSVSYFDYNDKREYLINNHYIFVVNLIFSLLLNNLFIINPFYFYRFT